MSYNKYTLKNSMGVSIPLNSDERKRSKDFNKALRLFNRELKDSDNIQEFIDRTEHTKKTTKRREEKKQRIRNARKHDKYQ